jgi:hypothetical protein
MTRQSLLLGIPVDIELVELPGSGEDGGDSESWGFVAGERLYLISEVVDGWMSDGHKYVGVTVRDGRRFILRQDAMTDRWCACRLVRA